MAQIMPTRTDVPHYTFELQLEQRTYAFEFRWNERAGAWFFSIADADGAPLLSGRKVTLGLPLLARFRDPRLPAGDLEAVDTTGQNRAPGLDELGSRVKLLYLERAELGG